MICRAFQSALDRRGVAAADESRFVDHLAACASCRALATRLDHVRQHLAAPVVALEPPPAFAARVVARLPRREELLGWAALRVLPVSLALAIVAGYLVATSPSPLDLPPTHGSDGELLAWLLFVAGRAQ